MFVQHLGIFQICNFHTIVGGLYFLEDDNPPGTISPLFKPPTHRQYKILAYHAHMFQFVFPFFKPDYLHQSKTVNRP